SRVKVVVRVRPLFAGEEGRGEFGVVSVLPPSGVVIHNCCMAADLKRMHIRHAHFGVSHAFGEGDSTEEVCERGLSELISHVGEGGSSTIFMYGQTGSGKTYTMAGIERYAASMLLGEAEGAGEAEGRGRRVRGGLSVFEIAGSRCVDLLGERAGQELQLKTDAHGRCEPQGVSVVGVGCGGDVVEALSMAKARRSTSATGANAESSRSHAVCVLRLLGEGGAGGEGRGRGSEPTLTLVDCAGSERKEDNDGHNAAQRREGAEINESLFALKECMRQWVGGGEGRGGGHVPFRMSALTRGLAHSFTRGGVRMGVGGTISPSCNDTEHSIHTLKTVGLVGGGEACVREVRQEVRQVVAPPPSNTIPPKAWEASRLRKWLGEAREGRLAPLLRVLPAQMEGKRLMRMTAKQMETLWGASHECAQVRGWGSEAAFPSLPGPSLPLAPSLPPSLMAPPSSLLSFGTLPYPLCGVPLPLSLMCSAIPQPLHVWCPPSRPLSALPAVLCAVLGALHISCPHTT
ncbi:MAG: hypothetical protein SGPRY_006615, partial [Prymnesium sp.]